MAKQALIVWGGWDGHQPKQVGEIFTRVLKEAGFGVEISDTLNAFNDKEKLNSLSLILPIWTMGKIEGPQCANVIDAVANHGIGIAGIHGGMCDSFRDNCDWQFLTGGQFVAHPGNDGTKYTIEIKDRNHEITRGISDFPVSSEQYYMHVDPAAQVLATCKFPTPGADGPHVSNGPIDMPVIWTRRHGKGKVFYSSIGHDAKVTEAEPHLTILKRGFLWAAK